MEGQGTSTTSSERRKPLIDKDEAKELALGIARLVEARGEPPKKTLVDSDELARQVDADFTCFLCRKRCRTKSRFLTHFRSHFKAAGIGGSSRKRRRLDNNNDDNSSIETSDDETSNDEESLKEEPLHLRGVDNNDHPKALRQQRRKKRNLKSDPRSTKRSRNPLLSTGGSSMDPDGDSGCHSIDDDAGSTSSSSSYTTRRKD